jgi:chemotaxis protein MotB
LSAAGYAEFHPVALNDSAEGRARNRRVDIVILNPNPTLQEFLPAKPTVVPGQDPVRRTRQQ